MQLTETLAFVTVVDAGSFTAAGKRLDVPKSTLSRQVTRLEERLGARLLQRTTRKLSLTETGRAYFDRCRSAIDEIRDAERLAQDVSGVPRGRLKVSSPIDVGRQLASLITPFRKRYPEIEFELELSQRRVDMVAENFDVALRGGELPDSSFVSRKIADSELLLCASPDYLTRHGHPRRIEDLADHQVVSLNFPGDTIRLVGPDGPVMVKLNPWLTVNEWSFVYQLMVDGQGIGPNLIQVVRGALKTGELVRVLPEYSLTGGGLYAVYPSRHHLSPKVRVFVDYLVETIGVSYAV